MVTGMSSRTESHRRSSQCNVLPFFIAAILALTVWTVAAGQRLMPCSSLTPQSLSNNTVHVISNCGCFTVVYLEMPTYAVNVSIIATGSYVSIVAPTNVMVMRNVTVVIDELYCAYNSLNYVNDTMLGSHYSRTSLPPFLSLTVLKEASSLSIVISNVLITEPSLGGEVNSIAASRIMITWIRIYSNYFNSTVVGRVSILWRNVTLSHGGAQNGDVSYSGVSMVLIAASGFAESLNITIIDSGITQVFDSIVTFWPQYAHAEASLFRFSFGNTAQLIVVRIHSSSIRVSALNQESLNNSSGSQILALSDNSQFGGCWQVNIAIRIAQSHFGVNGCGPTALMALQLSNASNVTIHVVSVIFVTIINSSDTQQIAAIVKSVMFGSNITTSGLVINDTAFQALINTTFNAKTKKQNDRGIGGVMTQALFAGCAFIATMDHSDIALRNLSVVAEIAVTATDTMELDTLVIAVLLIRDAAQSCTVTLSSCSITGSFTAFGTFTPMSTGVANLALVSFGGTSSSVALTLHSAQVELLRSISLPGVFMETTSLVSLLDGCGAPAALRMQSSFLVTLLFNELSAGLPPNIVEHSAFRLSDCNVSSIVTSDQRSQVVLLALPNALLHSTIAIASSSLMGDSVMLVFPWNTISSSSIAVTNASLSLSGALLSGPMQLMNSSELLIDGCHINRRVVGSTVAFSAPDSVALFGMSNSTIVLSHSVFRSFKTFFNQSGFNATSTAADSELTLVGCNEWRLQPLSADSGLRMGEIARPVGMHVTFYPQGPTDTHCSPFTETATPSQALLVPLPLEPTQIFVAALAQGIASAVAGGLAMSAAASMQGLAVLGGSMCAPPQVRSSSTYTQYLISPFSDLGGVGVVCGNAGVTLAVFALQRALIAWRMRRRKESLEHAGAKVRYPGWTYVAAVKMMQGVLRSSVELFQVQDAVSGVSRGGGIAVGVLGILYCLVCVALSIQSIRVAFDKMIFVAYPRRAYGSARFLALKRFLLPIGYWGDESMKSRYGKVVNSVHSGGFRFVAHNVLTTTLVNAAMLASSAGGNACTVLFAVCAATNLVAATLLLIYRPSRTPCAGWFDVTANLLSSVVSLLLLLMMVEALSDEGQAVAAVGMVLSVVCLAQSVHGICVTLWERRLSRAKKKKQNPSRPRRPQTHGKGTKLKQLFTSVSGEVKNAAGDVGSQFLLEFVPEGYREIDAVSSSSSSTGSKLARVRNAMDRRTPNTAVDDGTNATLDSLIRLACQRTLSL